MRSILTLLICILLFASCSEVRFSEPQPQNGKELDEIPNQFIGRYLGSDGDTLVVNSECFLFADDELKKLCSDRVVLKKKDDLHFISCKEILLAGDKTERKGWNVMPFELVQDTLMVYILNTLNEETSKETIASLEEILEVETCYNQEGKIEYYYIDPTIRQFERILSSQCFSIAEKFVKVE